MQSCWMENPLMRPTFQDMTKQIRYFLRKVKVCATCLLVTVSVLPPILKRFFPLFFLRFSVPVFLRAYKSLNEEAFVGTLLCNRHVLYRDRDDVGHLILFSRLFFFFRFRPCRVHGYPDISESATFSFWIRLPSTRIRRIRLRIRIVLNPLSRMEKKNISATNPMRCEQWIRIFSNPMT